MRMTRVRYGCTSKRAYAGVGHALRAAAVIERHGGPSLAPYECRHCGGVHLYDPSRPTTWQRDQMWEEEKELWRWKHSGPATA